MYEDQVFKLKFDYTGEWEIVPVIADFHFGAMKYAQYIWEQ